jgi:hypothetical protein
VILWNKKGGDCDNQQWYSDPPSGTIRSKMHDFCLTAEGQVVVKPFQPGDPNQQLEWADTVIRNKTQPNKCLEVSGGGAGDPVGLRDYNGNPNQVLAFELVAAGGGPGGFAPPPAQKRLFFIVSDLNGKVLDIKQGDAAPGTQVLMWSKHGGSPKNQLWYTDGQGHILSALNDMAFISQSSGDNIKMKRPSGDPHEQWYFEGQKIMNRSGLCLDIREGGKHDGADVLSYKYSGSTNQHWKQQFV